jgi:hypothetical protein
MSLIKHTTRFMAAAMAASFILTPVAAADKGRGRGHDDHRGGYDRRDDRRDYRRDDRRDHRRYDRHDHYYDSYRSRPVVVYRRVSTTTRAAR